MYTASSWNKSSLLCDHFFEYWKLQLTYFNFTATCMLCFCMVEGTHENLFLTHITLEYFCRQLRSPQHVRAGFQPPSPRPHICLRDLRHSCFTVILWSCFRQDCTALQNEYGYAFCVWCCWLVPWMLPDTMNGTYPEKYMIANITSYFERGRLVCHLEFYFPK